MFTITIGVTDIGIIIGTEIIGDTIVGMLLLGAWVGIIGMDLA
jgi:hypothetical protein